jgi:hypothetical protein
MYYDVFHFTIKRLRHNTKAFPGYTTTKHIVEQEPEPRQYDFNFLVN